MVVDLGPRRPITAQATVTGVVGPGGCKPGRGSIPQGLHNL
jgi:hypothetical protein